MLRDSTLTTLRAEGGPRRLHPLATLCLPLLLLLTAPPAQGQVILNTERFQIEEVDGFHLGAELSASLQRGNTELLNVSSSGIIGSRYIRHWPRLIFGGRFLRDDDRSLLDQQFAQLRYSYILNPRLRTFHFVQAQKNETLLLRSRWLVGTGIRHTFVQSERLMVAAGTGVMGEWERLDQERLGPEDLASLDAIRMTNLGVVRWTFSSGARLMNIVYLQPDLGEFSDARILNDLGLSVPVTDRVSSSMSLEWRHDTRPPSTLGKNDLTLTMGLGVHIR